MSKIKKNNFQQFIKQEDKGARLKEKIRQEKKKVRLETKEYFAQQKQARSQPFSVTDQDKPAARTGNKAPYAAKPGSDRSRPARPSEPRKDYKAQSGKPALTIGPRRTEPAKKTIAIQKPVTGAKKASAVPKAEQVSEQAVEKLPPGTMPLNKYIAHAGICSRRDAAEVVRSGKVHVNGQPITEPGFKVSDKDDIRVQGKKISATKHLVYILLNKPKDHITTTEDPEGRKTVMDLVKKATPERVYPVGRLDRNTTGVMLLTNDGELAQKLSHPSYQVRKIYEVTLDKPLVKKDFDSLLNGITLEDGFIAPDSLAYADGRDKSVIGIEIHSGKNRIVRRIFEKLGYDVRNLDRVMYANLTKKNVERGKWRFLIEKEVRLLKFMNASYARNSKLKP
ncbi:MAG: pseudouridine synthase [Flavitalea sp.]